MAATGVSTDDFDLESDVTLAWYDSTTTEHYGFCSSCGASLFWRSDGRPGHLAITAGTLDPPTGLTTGVALFLDEHGDYHTPEPVDESHPLDRPT